jgi:CRISPR-associated protein Csx3
METVKFVTTKKDIYTLIEFEIEGSVCSPDELKNYAPPEVDASKGVILSGRGPVWLFGWLIHHYHPTAWVATFDPRLGGGVVVASHVKDIQVGKVISIKT